MTSSAPAVVRFNEALANAIQVVRAHHDQLSTNHVLVRDLYGRISLVSETMPANMGPLRAALHSSLGAFSPGLEKVILGPEDFFAVERITRDPDALPVDDEAPEVRLLERRVTGQDWLSGPDDEQWTTPPRIVFYGVKGGVGRSTALGLSAWHLGRIGKRVLIVDLDLESPGVSNMLLPAGRTPDFGVVDYLVESAVGQANDNLLQNMYAASPLSGVDNDIYVVPCGGKDIQNYAPKLGRAYLSVPSPSGVERSFSDRLNGMLDALTEAVQPDVILIDSRAGIHDLAATTVTHLGGHSLFFAVNSTQTFSVYRALFSDMHRRVSKLRWLRYGWKMVAALVPEQNRPAYLESFLERSYSLFGDYVYDEQIAASLAAFNFDLRDSDAPHHPVPAFYSPEFFGDFSPINIPSVATEEQVRASYSELFRYLEDFLSVPEDSALPSAAQEDA